MVAQNPGRSRIKGAQRSMEGMSQSMQGMMHKPQEMIEEYPLSSTLVMFGLGLGVGLLISHAVCDTTMSALQHSNPWRHEPTSMEKLGQSMYSAFGNVFPESVMQRFHS